MYFNGAFNLDEWNDDAEYCIFDDFEDWSRFFMYKQFLGAQEEFTISDKYKHKRCVKWGKPCIILSNSTPNFQDGQWIEGNTFIQYLENPLYIIN